MMKVGYVQTSPVFGAKAKNFEQVETLLRGVQADLIVLPELFATSYAFTSRLDVHEFGELPGEETTEFLIRLSKSTNAIMVAGFIEVSCEQAYNASMMVDENGILGTYRKIHLFNKEKLWFTPGNKPFKVHEVRDARIGMMICFDWLFPEACRTLALQGADIIAHPANLVLPYCQKAMVTRCLENRVFAVTANRIGTETNAEDEFKFTGSSQITAPDGKVLSSAPGSTTHVDVIDIDVEKARDKWLNEFNNVLDDRRKEYYL
jgi:predicted amidohydrolase